MRDDTIKLLEEIRGLPLFSRLGQPCSHTSVSSWDLALKLCAGEVWSSVQLMTKNRAADKITALDWHRSQTWNVVCAELRPQILEIVRSAVGQIAASRKVTEDFAPSVSWDLLGVLIEVEFSDIFPPSFYLPRIYPVYREGHFPCGWTGSKLDTDWSSGDDPLPDAQILVY